MKILAPLTALLGLSTLFSSAADASKPAPALKELRGKFRVILVSAPARAKVDLERQRALYAAAVAECRARDLVLVELAADPAAIQARARYHLPADRFTVLLIGKDGGEKARASAPTKPQAWFSLIDRMPMRREEIRAAKGQ